MGNASIAPGELVHLLAEVRAGGRIHEIGSTARVVAVDDSWLTLELGGAGDTVSCRREHVSPGRRHRASVAFRPATA